MIPWPQSIVFSAAEMVLASNRTRSCQGPQSSVVLVVQVPLKVQMELRRAEEVAGHKAHQIKVAQGRKAQLGLIMSKIFYNKTTGDGAVFDDDANIADWPDFQAESVAASATQVRAQRDKLLASSDSMALSDRITDEWRTYRQALRDLPSAEGFPANVTWPSEPS